jgi:rare lipoprotein A
MSGGQRRGPRRLTNSAQRGWRMSIVVVAAALGLGLGLGLAGCGGAAATSARRPTTGHPQPRARVPRPTSSSDSGPAAPGSPAAGDASPAAVGLVERGEAVWYGADWHGKPTASGERFDRRKLTAAHRTLPLGATVRVTNERNNVSVTVRINDRGPYGKRRQRIIDVSEAAAKVLGIIDAGSCPVSIEVLSLPAPAAPSASSRKGKSR